MGIEVDDADFRRRFCLHQAQESAESGFVAAAKHQRPMAGAEDCRDAAGKAVLGGRQIAVWTVKVAAAVVDRVVLMPGQIHESLANRHRSAGGADAALIAANALLAGKAYEHHAGGSAGMPCGDALMPADGQRPSPASIRPCQTVM